MKLNIIKGSLLIVLYNKDIRQSKTITSIIQSKVHFSGYKLVIWNNGPRRLVSKDVKCLEEKGFDVEIVETVSNISLAVLYNKFISMTKAERYVILDDDSTLNDLYLEAVKDSNKDALTIPIVTSGGKPRSPIVDGKCNQMEVNPDSQVAAIGSGIIIGRKLIDSIHIEYNTVFDERFYLYGVDSTFFIRVCSLLNRPLIDIINGFEHSLSRLEDEGEELKQFRRRERACDCALTLRYYSRSKFISYLKLLKMLFVLTLKEVRREKTNINLVTYVKCALSGKHYRNNL